MICIVYTIFKIDYFDLWKFWVMKLVSRLLAGNKPTRPWTIQKKGKPGENKEDFADPPPTTAAAAASSQHHAARIPPSKIHRLPRVHLVHPKHSRSPPLPFASTTLPPLRGGVEVARSVARCPDLPGDG